MFPWPAEAQDGGFVYVRKDVAAATPQLAIAASSVRSIGPICVFSCAVIDSGATFARGVCLRLRTSFVRISHGLRIYILPALAAR